ncbi:glycosyltransferase family A protein [Microcoleus sp. T2B6]|uniref:glycosyltransferase family A protein n=1 Tax=Microcoleus sp. T2B6 TaxID=3055424 RepID=UPI002FD32E48
MKSAVIITPTIGTAHLSSCLESVQKQNYKNLSHLIVIDGEDYQDIVFNIVKDFKSSHIPIHLITLPKNTGKYGFNGHRIYAGFSYLVEAEIIFFLDEDNWFDTTHVTLCIETINKFEVQWVFALRRICQEDGTWVLDDNCDSLGYWKRFESYESISDGLDSSLVNFYKENPFLVDTNCMAISKHTLTQVGHLWFNGYRADAILSNHLVRTQCGASTGFRTVNYRLHSSDEKGMIEYFTSGNKAMDIRYQGIFPWLNAMYFQPPK